MDRPDIYTDGVRPERCANCGHANVIKLHTIHGVERTELGEEHREGRRAAHKGSGGVVDDH